MKLKWFKPGYKIYQSINLNVLIECLLIISSFTIILEFSLKPVTGVDTDFFWHLATGEVIWTSKKIPVVDIFSHTKYGSPWINYSWGFDLLLYLFYHIGNFDGPILLRIVLLFCSMIVFGYISKLRGASLITSLIAIIWISIIESDMYAIRPHFITLFCSSLMLLILELAIRGRYKLAWLLPLLIIFWANFHGPGSPIGIIVVIIYGFIDILQRKKYIKKNLIYVENKQIPWLKIIFLCFIALCITPNHLYSPYYIISCCITSNPYRSIVLEGKPLNLFGPEYRYIISFLIFILFSTIYMYKTKNYSDLLLLITFIGPIFLSGRYVYTFLPFFTPVLACFLEYIKQKISNNCKISNPFIYNLTTVIKISIVICLSIVILRESIISVRRAYPLCRLMRWETLPNGACNFLLKNKIKGKLFNFLGTGGYLIWKLKDSNPVYIDGRNDTVYDADLLEECFKILSGKEESIKIINRHNIDIIIQNKEYDNFPIFNNKLPSSNDWFLAYEDIISRVYLRKSIFYKQSHLFIKSNFTKEDYFIPYLMEGKKLLQEDKMEDAIEKLEKARIFYPDCQTTQFYLAMAYKNEGSIASALRQLNLIILMYGNDTIPGTYFLLGLIEIKAGNKDMAACYISEELKLQGNNEHIKNLLSSKLPYHDHRFCFIKYWWKKFWAPFLIW